MGRVRSMSTNFSPADKIRFALERAERIAREQDWKEYREMEERHRRARFHEPEHGKLHTYRHYECRCEKCVQAYEAEKARRRATYVSRAKPKPPPKPPKREVKAHMHGTSTGYSYGCRCERCRDTRRKWAKQYRTRQHGTEYVYTLGCRCKKCTQAHTEARNRRRARSFPNPNKKIEHGTDKGYTHDKCRCEECKKAHREAVSRRKKARREYYRQHPEMIPTDKHGTSNGYVVYSCRCDECREAHRVDTAQRRARKREQENARD